MTLGSLFDGISGFPLAASWCGIETKWLSEIDPYCLKLSKQNFPNALQYGDIKEIGRGRKYEPGPIDIICGGFPCQPFSFAGRREGENDNRYLWPEMFRVIEELKPKYIIGENVYGIIKMPDVFEEIIISLEGIGYKTQAFIIPACAVGAEHKRNRVWFLSYAVSDGLQIEVPDNECTKKLYGEKSPNEINNVLNSLRFDLQRSDEHLRRNNGVPNWMDRIKGLGNAIVPQVAKEFFDLIIEIEKQKKL